MISRIVSLSFFLLSNRLQSHRTKIDSSLFSHHRNHGMCLSKDRGKLLPECLICKVPSGRVYVRIGLLHRVDSAARSERATLAPAIAVVVNAWDQIRIIDRIIHAAGAIFMLSETRFLWAYSKVVSTVVGTDITTHFKLVFEQLKTFGLLLESDPKLPSVCTLIAGTPMKGSWWSHPMAQIIFQVNERLEDHKDVLITKLVAGKVTFIHRKLWPEIVSIGAAREPWQFSKLSNSAQWLLKTIDARGSISTDELPLPPPGKTKIGDAARELEKKLLVSGAQIHTESGAHAKVLETWPHWAAREGLADAKVSPAIAKKILEERMLKLNQESSASAKLPWQ